jgi:hypothetical protein
VIVRLDQRLPKVFVEARRLLKRRGASGRRGHAEGTIKARGEGAIVAELGDYRRARDFHHPRSRLRFDPDVRRPPLEERHFADHFPFSDSAYQLPSAAIIENVRSAVADPA